MQAERRLKSQRIVSIKPPCREHKNQSERQYEKRLEFLDRSGPATPSRLS
jgi:hypothetical protein